MGQSHNYLESLPSKIQRNKTSLHFEMMFVIWCIWLKTLKRQKIFSRKSLTMTRGRHTGNLETFHSWRRHHDKRTMFGSLYQETLITVPQRTLHLKVCKNRYKSKSTYLHLRHSRFFSDAIFTKSRILTLFLGVFTKFSSFLFISLESPVNFPVFFMRILNDNGQPFFLHKQIFQNPSIELRIFYFYHLFMHAYSETVVHVILLSQITVSPSDVTVSLNAPTGSLVQINGRIYAKKNYVTRKSYVHSSF